MQAHIVISYVTTKLVDYFMILSRITPMSSFMSIFVMHRCKRGKKHFNPILLMIVDLGLLAMISHKYVIKEFNVIILF